MAKSNRRRSNSRQYAARRPAQRSSGAKWVFFGILVGALGMFFLWPHPPHSSSLASAEHNVPARAPVKKHNTNHTTPKTKAASQYDFYTMLPKMEVKTLENRPLPATPPALQQTIPAKAVPQAVVVENTPKTIVPAVSPAKAKLVALPPADAEQAIVIKPIVTEKPSKNYVVQVANVRDYAVADRLKAELTMLGFDVSLQDYTVNGESWNRVLAGSFPTKQEAIKQQKRLKQSNIGSTLIKN